MALFTMRDSWNVWRRKVNEAIGTVEPIKSEDVTYDNTDSGLTATNVQSAIDEVATDVSSLNTVVGDADSGLVKDVSSLNTVVGDADSGLVKDVTTLKAKGYKVTKLFEGDASANGSSGVDVTVADINAYDAIMMYYNAGNITSTFPIEVLKYVPTNLVRMQYDYGSNTLASATIKYIDAQKITVNATQNSTMYVYGINYNA